MNQHKIKKILTKKLDELTGLGKQIGNDFDKEVIHNFRVAVKSLRSFLRLLQVDGGNADLKITKKFKRLYHIAGTIRNIQLEVEKLTGKKLALPVYLDYLHHKETRKKAEWQKHNKKKTFRKFRTRLTANAPGSLSPGVLVSFIKIKLAAANNLVCLPSLTDNQVHGIRKLVKDMLYTVLLSEKEWKAGFNQVKSLATKPLEQIADTIGHYNDDRVIMDHLRSFLSKLIEGKELAVMESFCNKEMKRLKREKKRTLQMVSRYLENERENI